MIRDTQLPDLVNGQSRSRGFPSAGVNNVVPMPSSITWCQDEICHFYVQATQCYVIVHIMANRRSGGLEYGI
jgi:hypothetical protein